MSEIVDFLLARLDEDEALAQSTGDPARVLREVRSKREQIAHLVKFMEEDYAPWNEGHLMMMADVYSGHPDHKSEWASSDS